jgi:hypothetical protein
MSALGDVVVDRLGRKESDLQLRRAQQHDRITDACRAQFGVDVDVVLGVAGVPARYDDGNRIGGAGRVATGVVTVAGVTFPFRASMVDSSDYMGLGRTYSFETVVVLQMPQRRLFGRRQLIRTADELTAALASLPAT